jgi:hypothetical protein
VDDPNVPYDTPDSLKEGFGKDVRSVVLWEIYDLDHQTITTVSPGCEYKLREVPLPDYLNGGFPFIQFSFNPIPGDVYPLSDIAPHEGQIIELIKILSIEINHLKRWNRQMVVDADTFTPDEAAKFKDANDGAIITAQTTGAKDKIFIPPYAPVQSDVYQIWNQVYDVWRSISGQTQTDQGGQAKTQTRTLGELRMQLQGGHARSEEKVDVLEDSIAEVAKKLLSIIQKKYDLPKITRLVGPKSVQKKILKTLPQRPSAQPQHRIPVSRTLLLSSRLPRSLGSLGTRRISWAIWMLMSWPDRQSQWTENHNYKYLKRWFLFSNWLERPPVLLRPRHIFVKSCVSLVFYRLKRLWTC